VNGAAAADGDVAQGGGQVGLADADQIGDRLQHLRELLPRAVRVVAVTHPLYGRVLEAVSFIHRRGVLHLVVRLPDSSPGTIPASATDVFGERAAAGPAAVLDADGLRRLRALVTALSAAAAAGRGRAR
jgi:hypothetical protein